MKKSIDDTYQELDNLCDNHLDYTDEELSEKLKIIYHIFPIHHMKMENIVANRVKKYCDKNKMKLEDYKGVLPYRKFIIPVNNLSYKEARKKIKSLMKNYEDMNISLDNLGNLEINQKIDDVKQIKYTYKNDKGDIKVKDLDKYEKTKNRKWIDE